MDIMGIVSLDSTDSLLGHALEQRPLAILSFGGKYRLIDFILSNMVHSGISHVGVFMRHPHPLLLDHLRSGKDWDLERKQDGLVIFPQAQRTPSEEEAGNIGDFYRQLDWIKQSRQNYVAFTGDGTVCNVDYRKVLQFHREKQSDITAVYASQPCTGEACPTAIRLTCNPSDRIISFQAATADSSTNPIATGVFILEKKLFVTLLEAGVSGKGRDFIRHCLVPQAERYRCYGFGCQNHVSHIYSLPSYYQANMALLQPRIWQEMFSPLRAIYTRASDEPPAKYAAQSRVTHSLVAGGCIIEGVVENSILFRGVHVKRGAIVRNSLVLQNSRIGDGVVVDYVVCDSQVDIGSSRHLTGTLQNPLLVRPGDVM